MKIHSLKVRNYRCFEDLEVEFDPTYNLHVIIAPNMVGKSALVKAIRIAASSYLRKVVPLGFKSIAADEHRVIGKNPFSDVASECSIQTKASINAYDGKKWSSEMVEWRIYRDAFQKVKTKYESISTGRDLDKMVRRTYDRVVEKKEYSLPVFLYVGTDYIHQPHAKTDTLKEDGSALQGYWYCFEEKSMESYVFDWLKKMHDISKEQKEKENARLLYEGLPHLFLNSFENAIKAMFPDEIVAVEWITNHKESKTRPRIKGEQSRVITKTDSILTFGFKNEEVRTYDMLSDGYRYLILLIGELITRCVLLNKHLGDDAVNDTAGIVLIDEFGIHLHPELQMSAIDRLCRIFPNIQFIISTHSPLLLNGLKQKQIHILTIDEKQNRQIQHPDFDVIGLGAEGILTEIFGMISTLDNTSRERADRYKYLFQKKTTTGSTLTEKETIEFQELERNLMAIDMGTVIPVNEDPLYVKFKNQIETMNINLQDVNEISDRQVEELIKEIVTKGNSDQK